MFLLKIPFKLLALLVILFMTLVEWFCVFLISFSSVILNLFAGLCFLIAILGYLMQICTGQEAITTLIMGFVVLTAPAVGIWIITKIISVNTVLKHFVKS